MNSDIPFLPQEIITNILKRLPVKSLLRFRCVCKHWKNLIKTPSFISDHLQHSKKQKHFLIWHRSDGPYYRRIQMLDYNSRVFQVLSPHTITSLDTIVGSCNGLLCVRFYRMFSRIPVVMLWNPATRKARRVPRPFNNVNNNYKVGFGFSPSVNDYKIVLSHGGQFFYGKDNLVEL